VPDRAAELERLAGQWAKLGRTLWVVADAPATIHSVLPAATIHHTPVVTNPYFLERSLLRRPRRYAVEPFSLVLAPVPVPAS
jgi:hypothetical protein